MTHRQMICVRALNLLRRAGRLRSASLALIVVGVASLLASGCGSGSRSTTQRGPDAARWIDQPVTFTADGMKIYGTFRHPVGDTRVPAVLLIAGSGPTDRNGNSKLEPGAVDTIQTVAGWLGADGVASLRYDKLGTGQTGLGPYAGDPSAIGIHPFEQEAVAGLGFLARQPSVDPSRLGVIGHSEGGLFALMLAAGAAGPTPPIHAIGLLEPLSLRSLTLLDIQLRSQLAQARAEGRLTVAEEEQLDAAVDQAVTSLRSSGAAPENLPSAIAAAFSPVNDKYVSEIDQLDPAQLAARLPAHTPVLVTCSTADIQVSCSQVDRVVEALGTSHAATDFLRLNGVDHVLKVDSSRTALEYTAPLPFSPQLKDALRAFVDRDL